MAEVKVNAEKWAQLPKSDQDRITDILRKSRLLDTSENIAPTPAFEPVEAGQGTAEGSLCKIACDAAQAAAIEACNSLSGAAKTICIVAAQAAGDECRKRC